MADIFRGQGSSIARALLPALLFVVCAIPAALAQLYEQPVLIIDPGKHTGPIKDVGVDSAGRIAVTGSDDKTLRVWSLPDGELLRTIHVPAGPDNVGKIFAVAVDPVGALVAAGGWTNNAPNGAIYVFETQTGKMAARIGGLLDNTLSLAFSPDGRYLAAGIGGTSGLRVYDRERQWRVVSQDTDYRDGVDCVTFSADGRLASASRDGNVRLYDSGFRLVAPPREMLVGRSPPFQIAFSPDGALLAVSHTDAMKVDLLDGHSLAPLPGPNFDGLNNGSLGAVTWSRDGTTLYAGGQYLDGDTNPVVAWANAGRGARHALPAGTTTVARLAALPDGRLLVATRDPLLKLFEPDGSPRWTHTSPKVEFRNQYDRMAVSADGTVIDFSFEPSGRSPLRFDLRALKLTEGPPAKQAELAIERWRNDVSPSLNVGDRYETSRSLAIHPNGSGLVLGTDWYLRAFDAKGRQIWQRSTPAPARVVNISADGRLVIAACGDGTIRWHRLDDGRELLALYVSADKNWVAWTPEGFYGASAGAFGLLQWQVNRGLDAAADTVPINEIQRLRRPDALALVIQELETARALGIADLKAARRDVQSVTRSTKAPGARLHVLTIGISDYGGKARNLRLNFAHRDAQDVASALDNTQGGGLYAEVKPQFLHDGEADRGGIFEALAAMDRNMTGSAGQDLAVVMFSGHGTMIDNQFYLVPYGADNSTTARLKASAIPATEFRSEIEKLAQHGRVLVLLDACRSAGLIGGPSNSLPAAEVLRAVMNARHVTVLTSSSADKVSREDEKWGHGAFTKALLDALSASDDIDTNRDGVISMSELTAYIEKRLAKLTDGDQQLGLDQRFQGDVFVAGL